MGVSRVTGVGAVIEVLKRIKVEGAINIAEGLEKCGGVILRKAHRYVPKDTLALDQSGYAKVTGVGLNAQVEITYGGPTAPYAGYVHEDMMAKHAAPTCAKYLEKAVRETRGTCASIMARSLKGGASWRDFVGEDEG